MRESGVLLAVSSLPSRYGIGCFDEEAYRFIDLLKKGKQSYWQILPLGPTSYGDSPYQSFSTFAGNPYFISLTSFIKEGLLTRKECAAIDFGKDPVHVDYEKLYKNRLPLLRIAYQRAIRKVDEDFHIFCETQAFWLEDYALFMALKDFFQGEPWNTWPEDIRLRYDYAIAYYRDLLREDMNFYRYLQYKFSVQWKDVKRYANKQGIKIIGDLPIYVAFDSADTWANPELFQLDDQHLPTAVAGCPPDGFSATGQLWGNPLYRWDVHERNGYAWWIQRLTLCYEWYDVIRIDHFRGFDEYYAIPYGEDTAMHGQWQRGPGYALFSRIKEVLPEKEIIAEDLGYLTDSVRKLVKDCGYPGMKVLEFAFDSRDSSSTNDYLPHNYIENCVAYSGTHDNETLKGWFSSILPEEKRALKAYLHHQTKDIDELVEDCIALIMRSNARLCIIPMQDWLKQDNTFRMNTPSTLGDNWKYRVQKKELSASLFHKIANMTRIYGRCGKQE